MSHFANARKFSPWLGLVPSQNSTGGKARLGHITKRGDAYLRGLLIQGAKAAVMTASKRSDRISQWLVQLTERLGWQKAVVAMANKNARILWTVLTRDTTFDPDHVPQRPAARTAPAPSM
jgi:transposase